MGVGSSLASGVVPNVVIARWFHKDLGKAISILSMGYGLGGIMVPLVRIYVDHFGWQDALLYSSIGLLVLGIPLAFVYRSRPADYGLEPDGKPEDQSIPTGRARNFDFSTSIRESLKLRAFWHIAGLSLVQYALTGAFMLYVVPYLTSPGIGMSRADASMVAMVYSLVSLGYRIPLGFLADKYPVKLMNAIAIAAMGTGLLAFAFIHAHGPLWLVIVFGLTYGFGVAGLMPLKTALLAEYFGTRNFGAVYGLNSIFVTISVISSPVLAAMAFDRWGDSFSWVWIAGALLALIGAVLMLTMPASVNRTALEKDKIPTIT
jgi:MFS family permease